MKYVYVVKHHYEGESNIVCIFNSAKKAIRYKYEEMIPSALKVTNKHTNKIYVLDHYSVDRYKLNDPNNVIYGKVG